MTRFRSDDRKAAGSCLTYNNSATSICGFEGAYSTTKESGNRFLILIYIGESSNGRKAVSKTVNAGSTPASPVSERTISPLFFNLFKENEDETRFPANARR